MGQIQGAVNTAIGTASTAIGIGQHLAQQDENIKMQQAQLPQQLGANMQMLSNIQEKIDQADMITPFNDAVNAEAKMEEAYKALEGDPENPEKRLAAASATAAYKEADDVYQRASQSLEGMEYEKQGVINTINFIRTKLEKMGGRK